MRPLRERVRCALWGVNLTTVRALSTNKLMGTLELDLILMSGEEVRYIVDDLNL